MTGPGAEDPETIPMNDATRRFFSGDSLQQAIIQAANYFNLDPDWVAYKSLEKRHGFLKTRRKVVIEVDPDNPKRDSPVSAPAEPGGGRLRPAARPARRVRSGRW